MANDTRYLYSGPLSGVTLDDGREVMLHPGTVVALPAENPYVRTLVAKELLTEEKTQPAPLPASLPAPEARTTEKKKEVTTDVS